MNDPIDNRIGPINRPRPANDPFNQQNTQAGTQRAEECRQYFSAFSQFTQQELLSVGGFGAVVKYAQADDKGKHLRNFVVKMPKQLRNEPGGEQAERVFRREFLWNVRLMGLKHMVQLAWLDQYPVGNQLGPGPWPKGNEDFMTGSTRWYLMFEYLAHGDLRELIYRLNEPQPNIPVDSVQIPARLMWRIFLCLTRACIGLAWPRLTADEAPVMARNLQPMPEKVERIGPTDPVSIVHFDFDPSNVLIGDFRDNIREHALQPVFKLGDFGLVEEITPQTTRDTCADVGLLDHVLSHHEEEASCHPHVHVSDMHHAGPGRGQLRLVPVPGRAAPPRGAEAMYRRYSRELRELVARCMTSHQRQRATVVYLLPWIQLHIKEGDEREARGQSPAGESNADIEKFCRQYIIGETPAPPAATHNNENEDSDEVEARDVLGDMGGLAGLLRALGRVAAERFRRGNQGDAGYAEANAQQQQRQQQPGQPRLRALGKTEYPRTHYTKMANVGRYWDPDRQRLHPLLRPGKDNRVNVANPTFLAARSSSRRFRENFEYTRLILKRTLGWGGFGIALKYEQVDANQQHVDYIAVKVPRAAIDDIIQAFEDEMRYYMKFDASEHIPRLLHFPPDMTEEQEDGTRALPKGNDQFWDENSTLYPIVHHAMILEYLEYSDFLELIYKLDGAYPGNGVTQVAAPGKHQVIPNRTLWRFFLCLTRSCIAMAYPRKSDFQLRAMIRSQTDNRQRRRSSVTNATVPWHEEVDEDEERARLIHKDLDPGNVFLGSPNPEDAEHTFNPIAKVSKSHFLLIADFGLMYDAAKGDEGILRTGGKLTWHAPEQFDNNVFQGPESFDAWTNIWGVGAIMYALMTRAMWRRNNREARRVPTPTPADPSRMTDTYGWHLDETVQWPGFLGVARRDQVDTFAKDYEKTCVCLVAQTAPHAGRAGSDYRGGDQARGRAGGAGGNSELETNAQLEAFYDQYFRSAPEMADPWEGMYN
ncbi:hypothetical protein PG997_009811 [Apiospora hydei]|uniref:Protein kinase domain-containing protein n=1 Tax=Apiospora hydei TaxID=1337664 RepID=A0ABR1VV78_9PEZI